jgi:spermidine synthase
MGSMERFFRRRYRNAGSSGGAGTDIGTNTDCDDNADVHISEEHGVRSLHLGSSMVQSAMRLSSPNHLELAYTQCMMCFTLFHPHPQNILMIGLGGGSLTKFVHQQLPEVKTTVIEINPQVVAVARSHFFVPFDDKRLQVVIAEGGEYVAAHPLIADVLMVDGFDDGRQVASLCSQDFYNRARETLKRNGVLVVNLLSRDKRVGEYIDRIENSFSGRVATVLAEPYGNLIVFAFKHGPRRRVWEDLHERAREREAKLGLPLTKFAKRMNYPKPS